MNLYNMVHGTNAMSPFLLGMLGNPDVPRFRDCYLDDNRIAIHTRTGGGNRDFYDSLERCIANNPEYFDDEPPTGPWNSDLRAIPGYLYDEDDDFDSTYATFYFMVPKPFENIIKTMIDIGAGEVEKPAEKWDRVLTELTSGEVSPQTQKSIEAMRPMMEAMKELLV